MRWLALLITLAAGLAHATTFHLSPTGSDSNNGLTTGTPWLTPNHSVNCGDVIVAVAGTYNGANFTEGNWGTVTCTAGNSVAWLQCGTFDGCKISTSTQGNGVWIDHSFWGISGWEVTVGTAANLTDCFLAAPNSTTNLEIHHIIFANNVANGCPLAGFGAFNQTATASVDYLAIVGNIAFNAAGGNGRCGSGITIFQPLASDTVAGTHIYVAGNFSYDNLNPNPCNGTPPTDGEGIILDTFDAQFTSGMAPYGQQAVVENNIVFRNGGKGFYIVNNNLTPNATVIFRHNTAFGDFRDPNMTFCAGNGDAQMNDSFGTTFTENLVQTDQANTQCNASDAKFALSITNANSTDTVSNNYMSGVSGNNEIVITSTGFTLGSNTFGTNPNFANPVDPGAPVCSGTTNTVACMTAVIADYKPTTAGSTTFGYQPVTTGSFDALFPAWLCTSNVPAGIITMNCSSPPSTIGTVIRSGVKLSSGISVH